MNGFSITLSTVSYLFYWLPELPRRSNTFDWSVDLFQQQQQCASVTLSADKRDKPLLLFLQFNLKIQRPFDNSIWVRLWFFVHPDGVFLWMWILWKYLGVALCWMNGPQPFSKLQNQYNTKCSYCSSKCHFYQMRNGKKEKSELKS